MASQSVIRGRVKEDGSRFVADDPSLVTEALQGRAGKPTELVLRDPKSKRSLDQNAYAHKWPFALIADAMGEGIEAAKLCILGEKFGWHTVRGREIPIKTHTSDLTVQEFDELIEWMIPWALDTFGAVIPLPGEAE